MSKATEALHVSQPQLHLPQPCMPLLFTITHTPLRVASVCCRVSLSSLLSPAPSDHRGVGMRAAAAGAARGSDTAGAAQPSTAATTRVLKPSLKQPRAPAPKPSTAPARPSRPSSAPSSSSPPSSLTKERLQANLQYYQFLTRVQSLLITTPGSSPATLQRASLVLRPSDYLEILSERSSSSLCSLPTCANPTLRTTGRYRLSLRQHRVWDVSEETLYCSPACEQRSLDYLAELKEDPLYLRRFGEVIGQQQQQLQAMQPSPTSAHLEQGRVVEALNALPTPSPSSYSSTALPLPAGADASSLVIREAASTAVNPVFAGSGAAIEGYEGDTPKVQRRRKTKKVDPLPLPSCPSTPVLPSLRSPVQATADADDEVDAFAEVALLEVAKRRAPMNPVYSATPAVEAESEEGGEVQGEQETKANFAAMRRAKVLSPFAEVVSVLNHWVGDDTLTLLAEPGPSRQVVPSLSEVVRGRQEALSSLLHRELHALTTLLPLPLLASVKEAVDSVALTFVANEQIPSLSSPQWQVILIVLLLALRRTSKAAWPIDEAAAFATASSLGFQTAQVRALLEILVPLTPTPAPAPSTPPASPPPPTSAPPSMLSLPRDVLSSILSFLPPSDMPTASHLSHLLHLLTHPFASSDLPLISHHTTLHTQRFHTLGYRDGLSDTRELLLQRAFDHSLHSAYTRTVRAEGVKGVVAALAMWSWRTGDADDEVWRRCDEVNANVMRRPSPPRIQLEEERTDTRTPLDVYCAEALTRAGVDGRQLLADLSRWRTEGAGEEDVEALVTEQMARIAIAEPATQRQVEEVRDDDAADFM